MSTTSTNERTTNENVARSTTSQLDVDWCDTADNVVAQVKRLHHNGTASLKQHKPSASHTSGKETTVTKQHEIYFSDLHMEAQQEVLDFFGIEDSSDGNFDIQPLFVLEAEVDDEGQETVRV